MLTSAVLKRYSNFANKIAIEAGRILIEKSRKRHRVIFKGQIDLVTDADLASEKYIIEAITAKYPDHSLLTEEASARENNSDFRWVIDPLDGTTNFAHDFPFYCVSIGLEYRGKIVIGAIYDPVRTELFHARHGAGAFLNDARIIVSEQKKLGQALLATGFPYDIHQSNEDNLKYFRRFIKQAQAVRRAGSAALDLCYLACGRFDGFWELKLHPWDTAAAVVIVTEAGGKMTDFQGREYSIYGKYLLASNGCLHAQMKKVLNV
nr:inositol monophosphatase [candidate division Zixibacteria bacterium]